MIDRVDLMNIHLIHITRVLSIDNRRRKFRIHNEPDSLLLPGSL